MVDGVQYVTVLSGWRMSGPSGAGHVWEYPAQKRRALTFRLDGNATLPPADQTPLPFVDRADFKLDADRMQRGAAVYAQRCGLCHGPNLHAGGSAPDLRKSGIALSLEGLTTVLHEGVLVTNGMPRYPELGHDEIEGIWHYIRQHARLAIAQQRE